MATVLLAYTPKDGTTHAVARLIAKLLRARGFAVDEQYAPHVDALWDCEAVVLGGALDTEGCDSGAWRFAERHAGALAHKPFAVFAVVPHTLDRASVDASRRELDSGRAAALEAEPFAMAVFGVGGHAENLRLPGGDVSAHDGGRQAIEPWAEDVAAGLMTALRGREAA